MRKIEILNSFNILTSDRQMLDREIFSKINHIILAVNEMIDANNPNPKQKPPGLNCGIPLSSQEEEEIARHEQLLSKLNQIIRALQPFH